MAAWNSSSLAASSGMRSGMKNGNSGGILNRNSKQDIAGKRMFGSKMNNTKKKNSTASPLAGLKARGISPNDEDADDMMQEAAVTHKTNKKKSLFNRKQFG